MSDRKIRMLFFPRETFPTDRVRLNTLFGRELLGRGHAIDLVMQAQNDAVAPGQHDWFGRSVWVGPTDNGDGLWNRVRKNVLGIWHDMRMLWRARAEDYDCILVSDKYLLAIIASVVAHARGLKFFFWMTFPYHEAQVTLGKERLARHPTMALIRGYLTAFFLYRWIIPRSDHIFVQSQRMAETFCAHGADSARLTPVVTGIDLAGISPVVSHALNKNRRILTIAYLGTLVRERRLEILIDMLAELKRQGMLAQMLFIGDGAAPEDRRVIEERAQALGLAAQVTITGFLPRRDALDLVRTADIGVSPFHPSPILEVASPTKLIEYLALGMPVVANSHPDQSLVLKESRAGVCVPWSARHFARGVLWLAKRNGAELTAMSLRGQAWVKRNRSYERIADDFERACLRNLSPEPTNSAN
jgi:glycosyltransferase involved in cell wall biosynthesis